MKSTCKIANRRGSQGLTTLKFKMAFLKQFTIIVDINSIVMMIKRQLANPRGARRTIMKALMRVHKRLIQCNDTECPSAQSGQFY